MQCAGINEQYFIATDVDTSADSISAEREGGTSARDLPRSWTLSHAETTQRTRTAEVHAGRHWRWVTGRDRVPLFLSADAITRFRAVIDNAYPRPAACVWLRSTYSNVRCAAFPAI